MSTSTVDYDSLAKQAGGASSVDYDNLAAQHGATSSTAPPVAGVPVGTISAIHQPDGVGARIAQSASDFGTDISTGSNTTALGRFLHKMGMQPLNAGQGEKVGDFMGSAPLGAAQVAQGGGELATPGQRLEGVKDVVGGTLKAATIPSAFVAPEAAEATADAGLKATSKLAGLFPSAERAKANFQSVMAAAKNQPVELDSAGDAALKLMDWQKKTQLGPTVNKFLNRVTNPKLGDLTYEEARDFYQLLGKMSSDEQSKLPPAVRYDLTRLVVGLKQDIGTTAAGVGKGQQYSDAMTEFAHAKRMEEWINAGKEFGINLLKYGVGPGAVGYAVKQGIDAATQK